MIPDTKMPEPLMKLVEEWRAIASRYDSATVNPTFEAYARQLCECAGGLEAALKAWAALITCPSRLREFGGLSIYDFQEDILGVRDDKET